MSVCDTQIIFEVVDNLPKNRQNCLENLGASSPVTKNPPQGEGTGNQGKESLQSSLLYTLTARHLCF